MLYKNIKNLINLRKKIKKYSFSYYVLNKNLIENEKYDFLIKKLQNLEKKYPKFKNKYSIKDKIYSDISEKFKLKKHNLPMLSIDNIYNYNNFKKYINNIINKYPKTNFCCELKIDGIAISLIYKNNYLIKALTRGNSIYGENVTENIKNIKNIPNFLKIKKKYLNIEIRGEIYISKKKFLKINKYNTKNKKKIFSNSRNLVSGTIKTLNKKIIKKRNLSFIGYDIIINNNNRLININHYKCLQKIKKLGFNIEQNTKVYSSFKKIYKFYKEIEKKRYKLNYEIDGIVIKINNRIIQNIIGENTNYIKWAIALKFKSIKKITKIKKIKYQIGKSGIIIPIGVIKEIIISNIRINKVNLHNINYLNKLSLSINNPIIIERSGDVIPKIYKVIKSNDKKIKIPQKCPSCNNKINLKEKIPKCYFGLTCNDQIKKNILNFISKNGFNILYIGPSLIEKLIIKKKINSILDILNLNINILNKIKGVKYKLANKIIKSINLSIKNITLPNLIYSLSIPYIGKSTSKIIGNKIKNIKDIFKILNKKKIKNIGKTKIKSINLFLKNKNNKNIIYKLYNLLENKKFFYRI